jgi:hypothetical protein
LRNSSSRCKFDINPMPPTQSCCLCSKRHHGLLSFFISLITPKTPYKETFFDNKAWAAARDDFAVFVSEGATIYWEWNLRWWENIFVLPLNNQFDQLKAGQCDSLCDSSSTMWCIEILKLNLVSRSSALSSESVSIEELDIAAPTRTHNTSENSIFRTANWVGRRQNPIWLSASSSQRWSMRHAASYGSSLCWTTRGGKEVDTATFRGRC